MVEDSSKKEDQTSHQTEILSCKCKVVISESGKLEHKNEDIADHYGRLNALASFEWHGSFTSRFS
ncbi:hypothetical protein KIN20_035411 [Parelaphostrongylus tenuis]|uniref:Uncharacterized protein n=1 Tax=Parelaphostrongylus tenuis TaxID=148309 RepID=A0AAD5RBL6_PARTN|nr:hypothetical protein KIN20_035411 [Parelaphostrongylus tenuis]